METLSFHVAEYEGPLDLLLHLISKHKVNIWDIEISSLLEQYMEQIRRWQEQDLEVASDFLEMASRLVYIKTLSLLPRHEEEEEEARAQ
ncbi:MAG TPA: segregation/condensation protein A, partial [Firmicutes bacterium]|nr:segregation/condensation protein A [Bacillota bacterium]